MTPEEHKKRHIDLHKSLDEIFADYILNHSGDLNFTEMPIIKLLEWSFEQTKNPNEPYGL